MSCSSEKFMGAYQTLSVGCILLETKEIKPQSLKLLFQDMGVRNQIKEIARLMA